MDKLKTAEWLLARITSPRRAEEIVGDLAEQPMSLLAFWRTVSRIALAFTWRWIVGVPAAMVSIAIIGVPYFEILKPQVALVVSHGQNLESDSFVQTSGYLLLAAITLASIFFLTLARYGWRSPMTRIAAAMTVPLALGSFALCAHLLAVGIGMVVTATLVTTFSVLRFARASVVVLGTAVAFWALLFLWGFCLALCVGLSVRLFGSQKTIPAILALVFWVAIYVGEAFLLSRTSHWLRVVVD